jgi:hypothetical protein
MTGPKTAVGLTLLCAFCLLALSASSASAALTTAGECTNAAGHTKDFEDAHCDKSVAPGSGAFGHILFKEGVAINLTATNDLTGTASNFVWESKIGGLPIELECRKVQGTSTVKNSGPVMTVTFGEFVAEVTECLILAPEICKGLPATVSGFKAKVTDPMNLKISTTKKVTPTGEEVLFHEASAGGTEMGLKFELTEWAISFSEACGFGTSPAPAKGVLYATPGREGGSKEATLGSGATVVFSKSSTIGGLTWASNPATLRGTLTFRKKGGDPLILTTTAS